MLRIRHSPALLGFTIVRHWFAILIALLCCTLFCAADGAGRSWSLHPLRKPEIPQVRNADWPLTPVDYFILHKLEQNQIAPAPAAAKNDLLRRVYFDLTGLPPTPEATDAFLADKSPGAYERVVDGLLASPRYGERWARHWIDVIHFAESHGHDQDRIRTNAWPYRDYVIDAFNSDKPYRRFIEEQIAGDVLAPEDPLATVALGFLAAGPWDESSLRDIREDTLDREVARYLDRDDVVTTTMSTFTSITVHCARCHQHKFDPVSQQDYYSLQAVFAATDRADRYFDPDPQVHRTRQKLLRTKALLEQKDVKLMASLSEPLMQAEAADWLKQLQTQRASWSVVTGHLKSAQGAILTQQNDGSILSTGKRPEKDTYVVTATNISGLVRAVRLELLPDPTLPHTGPGRQDNGNLHLSEFRLSATSPTNENRPVRISSGKASFNQDGWAVQHALDGNIKTAWGIYPKVGQSHHAAFALTEPLVLSAGSGLRFELEQQHGGGHLIGRFRLSTSTNEATLDLLPENIATLIDATSHTPEQSLELARYYLEQKIKKELEALPPPRKVYAGASDFAPDASHKPARRPRPVHVLKRGEISKRGELAEPGALSCIETLPARFSLTDPQDEGSRRAALAAWIADTKNPLTWRSIVNRVWHFHFGRGIVDTPNDFGLMGGSPSHPELLDWLAATFRDDGGSFKRLHKLIVLSATYRQSTRHHTTHASVDADNRLLWRMNRTRLDAEVIRDAILQMTGRLNLKMGGPSFMNFELTPGIHVTPGVDYAKVSLDDPELNRRSIYRFLFRTLPDPFMDTLDCPSGSQLTPVRTTSFTALQAMALLNDPFITSQSEKMAARVARHSNTLEEQIAFACRLVHGRLPRSDEQREFATYVQHHGLANFCRLLWNSNEFIFVN